MMMSKKHHGLVEVEFNVRDDGSYSDKSRIQLFKRAVRGMGYSFPFEDTSENIIKYMEMSLVKN
jgi:hypothetical protein